MTGQVLGGRYRILRQLGEGGMGTVYEAVQTNIERRFALKVLVDELRNDEHYLERFRREAVSAARLMHPHIVQVVDFVSAPGEPPFLVMEMLEGSPLGSLLRRGPIAPPRACRLTVQLLSALEAAHAAGIVHRDLKPPNVFLVTLADGSECVKLLDFGIAKLKESDGYSRLTATGVLIGTPRYAAPEQIASRPEIDARTDIYSVGVLLYCMLVGRPPFTSEGARLLIDIKETEPPSLRSIDPLLAPELVAIVERAMQKDPAARFSSAGEMSAALVPFTRDRGQVMASPQPTVEHTPGIGVPVEEPTARTGPRVSAPMPGSLAPAPPLARASVPVEEPTARARPRASVPTPAAAQPLHTAPQLAPRPSHPDPVWSEPGMQRASFHPYDPFPHASAPARHSSRWLIVAGAVAGLVVVGVLAAAAVYVFWKDDELLDERGNWRRVPASTPAPSPWIGSWSGIGQQSPGPPGDHWEIIAELQTTAPGQCGTVRYRSFGCTGVWICEPGFDGVTLRAREQIQVNATRCGGTGTSMQMRLLPTGELDWSHTTVNEHGVRIQSWARLRRAGLPPAPIAASVPPPNVAQQVCDQYIELVCNCVDLRARSQYCPRGRDALRAELAANPEQSFRYCNAWVNHPAMRNSCAP